MHPIKMVLIANIDFLAKGATLRSRRLHRVEPVSPARTTIRTPNTLAACLRRPTPESTTETAERATILKMSRHCSKVSIHLLGIYRMLNAFDLFTFQRMTKCGFCIFCAAIFCEKIMLFVKRTRRQRGTSYCAIILTQNLLISIIFGCA